MYHIKSINVMTQTIIAGTQVTLNEEGFFTDPSQWNESISQEMATELGITLTAKHMEIIYFLRENFKKNIPITIRKIGKSGLVDIKGFYKLFPGGPLKVSSKLAGIPKPASCV
jgi:tRNA 2-thiouridine synthesizing protein E